MTHQPLIERLQAAETGSRDLSEDMMRSLGWAWVPRHQIIPLTTSLDAILAEIERVFPCGRLGLKIDFAALTYAVFIEGEQPMFASLGHRDRVLAACIALLRALEARDNGDLK